MALLSLEGVFKRHSRLRREIAVLEDVWLEVEAGDLVGIWGTRRSGKSTLLRVAAGVERVDAGVVRFDGRDVAALSGVEQSRLLRGEIGYATGAVLGGALTASRSEDVCEHVAVPLLSSGWSLDEATAQACEMLARVGAAECAHVAAIDLSPGEAIKVAIARALVRHPRLLLVDEPATTPSPTERDEIRDLLRSLAGTNGLAVIVASEEVSVLRGAQRVLSIGDGRLLSAERRGKVLPFPAQRSARSDSQ